MNLVIGNSSQLSHYFSNDCVKISSRNVNFDYLKSNRWDSVYLTFSEQRIYDTNVDYITPNYFYTLEIIKSLLKNSNRIVCFTSCEMWNDLSGFISVDTFPKFGPVTNEYILSKFLLWNKILELRKVQPEYEKVIFIHPFYFNSTYRCKYFLFGKIFQSIINKEKIQVGDLNFYRDMVHTKFVVEQSLLQTKDAMIGSGKLFNVRDFIKDLYKMSGLDFYQYVQEQCYSGPAGKEKLIMAKVDWEYSYQNLLNDTIEDIENFKRKRR